MLERLTDLFIYVTVSLASLPATSQQAGDCTGCTGLTLNTLNNLIGTREKVILMIVSLFQYLNLSR